MKPGFSIILPVYNVEKSLRETLDNLALQQYEEMEIIAVDDGSTDTSHEILQGWKNTHPEVQMTIVKQVNTGLGGARNSGALQAKYEWCAFIDADDLWAENKLRRMASVVTEHDADVFYHSVKTFGGSHPRIRASYNLTSLQDLLQKGNPITPSAVVIKTSSLREFPFAANRQAEDLELWIRLLKAEKKFCHVKEVLGYYRESGGMSTNIVFHLDQVFKVMDTYYRKGWYPQATLDQAKRLKYFEAARYFHKNSLFAKATDFYKRSGRRDAKALSLRLLNWLHISL